MPRSPNSYASACGRYNGGTRHGSTAERQPTEHALQRGDRVTATVRRLAALEDLCDTYDDRLTVEVLDVTRPTP